MNNTNDDKRAQQSAEIVISEESKSTGTVLLENTNVTPLVNTNRRLNNLKTLSN